MNSKPKADSTSSPQFILLTEQQLAELPQPTWLVEQHLKSGSFIVLYGAPASAKTFVTIDLALSVATDQRWLDRFVTKSGCVVYIAAEGSAGLFERVKAWKKARGVIEPSKVYFLPDAPHLLDPDTVTALLTAIGTLPAQPILIVVDTLARCMVGGEENSAKDMGEFIASIDRLRKDTGAAVLIVHHSGKGGSAERGSSALRGAADTMVAVKRDSGFFALYCDKQKDSEAFPTEQLTLVVIPETESCALQVTYKAQAATRSRISDRQRSALEILESSFPAEGARYTEFQRALGMAASSFDRLLKALLRSGYIGKSDERYRLLDKGRQALHSDNITPINPQGTSIDLKVS